MGFRQGRLVADTATADRHALALGTCPLIWRQGVKHDAAAVMELEERDVGDSRAWCNRGGTVLDVEPDHLYPLVKGTDLRKPPGARPCRAVIITHERIGQETSSLQTRAPRLWDYLCRNESHFAMRKSSIYRGQPRFALFGIGPYSFAPYKVAVSGLHRPASFQALGPIGGRPVMVDDTCYLLPTQTAVETAVLVALCNDPIALELIQALSFSDAKRAVTKGLLQRIDLSAILMQADRRELTERAEFAALEHLALKPDEIAQLPAAIEQLDRQFRAITRPPDQRGRSHGIRTDQLF
jgi:hypothetical protein